MKLINRLALLAMSAFAAAAFANDAVKQELAKKYPEVKAERITKTNYGNLFEIYAGGEIIYTDEKVTFLLLGTLVDAQTRVNVSEARLQKLNTIVFNDLPFDQAIKLVRGNGSRRMAIFEDPNCGYCKKFEQDVNALDNITAYIFAYPILAQDSVDKSKSIWCSPDRLKAWQDLMLREKPPTAKGTCDTPIDKVLALGRKMNVTGTPTTFFEDGERISGALPKDRIEAKLAAVKAAPAPAPTVEAKR
ncbi:MAG: DsbC family protein [Burkholderiales bacterium]|nr:DsbC family protein [Burkholderiales bacterium]